jgi:hypothetical protein
VEPVVAELAVSSSLVVGSSSLVAVSFSLLLSASVETEEAESSLVGAGSSVLTVVASLVVGVLTGVVGSSGLHEAMLSKISARGRITVFMVIFLVEKLL